MSGLRPTSSRLGVAWLRGAPVLCRSAGGAVWRSAVPADSIAELADAIRDGARSLGVTRGEAHLLLAHGALQHRVETVPALSECALQRFLRQKLARESPELCWSAVRLLAARGEERVLLHLLPASWVAEAGEAFAGAGLSLARVFPLGAALESAAPIRPAGPAATRPEYAIAAAQSGGQTVLIAQRDDGALAFARSFGAAWDEEAERLGLEINRSVIYLRQRWNAAPRRVALYNGESVLPAVAARCGAGCGEVAAPPADLPGWLEKLAAVPPGDGRNLLAGGRRIRRQRWLVRTAAAAACWGGLALFALAWWSEAQAVRAARAQTAELRQRRPAAFAERDRLWRRNRQVAADRRLLGRMAEATIAPVPVRFLVYQAGLLPPALELSSYSAGWDGSRWTVSLEGHLRADDAAAHAGLEGWQERLRSGPWKAKFEPGGAAAAPGGDGTHFRLQGGLLED